jgi:phospholipid/cholesterol/gamma-HCH transport system ATP-binding protein
MELGQTLIEVKNLNFRYQDELILRDVNFEIKKGELVVVVGPRGEGKSTLLKILGGLIEFSMGDVLYDGFNLRRAVKIDMLKFHKKTSFVFQDAALISNMKIFDNVALPIRYHELMPEKEIISVVNELLSFVGLQNVKNLLPAYISMGQRKLISLIRAITINPETIFYDEPIANLDTSAQEKVVEIIKSNKSKGVTGIIITHEFSPFIDIVDRIIVLRNRTIYEIGTLEYMRSLNDRFVDELISN